MEYTKNETLSLMYENTAYALKNIASHIEEFKMEWEDVVKLLREISDEHEAQSMVVNLRGALNKKS